VFFPVTQPAWLFQTCGFWLALQSGATQGVARDYADGTDEWLGVQDAFANGPDATYPSSSSPGVPHGTGQISMYAEFLDIP
jgi:hypothetical protein